MTATTTTTLVPIQPVFSDAERLALAGFLAGYRGLTREAYSLDLRQFTTWCRARSLPLFAVRRADIEGFARELEARGRARATVTRRLCSIAGFYKYAGEEELLEHSPAAHVRRPRPLSRGLRAVVTRARLGVAEDRVRDVRLLQPPYLLFAQRQMLGGQCILEVAEPGGADNRGRDPGLMQQPG